MQQRDYQEKAKHDTIGHYSAGRRRVVVCIPTGGGKTVTAASIVRAHSGRTLWLAHREELIGQAERTLAGLGVKDYTVASLQTLFVRGTRPEADLVVVDECHHANARTYSEVIGSYGTADHLGLTATPQRTDGRALGDMYDHLVSTVNYGRLIDDGHLVDCRVISSVEALKSGAVAIDPVAAYRQHTPGQSAFLFAPTVELSKAHAKAFNDAGIPAVHVDGKTPYDERKEALRAFSDGEVQVMCNVNLFTEGTDVPRASVVILARGCGSTSLYLQMVGRALRPYPGKEMATLLDMTGAVHEHGLPTQDRIWTLEGSGVASSGLGALSMCAKCGACWDGGRKCPVCGYEKPMPTNDEGVTVDIRDVAFESVYCGSRTKRAWKHKVCRELWDWSTGSGERRKKAQGRYRELFGEDWPLNDVLDTDEKRTVYKDLVALGKGLGFKSGWADHRYRATFGKWPNAVKG